VNAVYWILPDLLAGRPGPEKVPWRLEELWATGFRAIVSLAEVDGEAVRAAGFRHYQDTLPGQLAFLPPLRRHLARRMRPALDFIDAEVSAGRPTLVHCRQGQDRTGAVLAAYLVRAEGLSPAEAVRQVRAAHPRAMISWGFDHLPAYFSPERSR